MRQTSTAAIGLALLAHNSYQAAGGGLTPAAYSIDGFDVSCAGGIVSVSVSELPAWVREGVVVSIANGGVDNDADLTGTYTVRHADSESIELVKYGVGVSGITFPESSNFTPSAGAALLLQCHCQKVLVKASGGSVTISPFEGSAWGITIPDGQIYEMTAPTGSKFDLEDWQATGADALVLLL